MLKMLLAFLSMVLTFSDCKSYDMGSGLQTRNSGNQNAFFFKMVSKTETKMRFLSKWFQELKPNPVFAASAFNGCNQNQFFEGIQQDGWERPAKWLSL